MALGLFRWGLDIKGHLGIFKNVYGRVVGALPKYDKGFTYILKQRYTVIHLLVEMVVHFPFVWMETINFTVAITTYITGVG